MNVKVYSCWDGGHKHFYRLVGPDGQVARCHYNRIPWNRATATDALNLIQLDWGVDRSKVRFVHV